MVQDFWVYSLMQMKNFYKIIEPNKWSGLKKLGEYEIKRRQSFIEKRGHNICGMIHCENDEKKPDETK